MKRLYIYIIVGVAAAIVLTACGRQRGDEAERSRLQLERALALQDTLRGGVAFTSYSATVENAGQRFTEDYADKAALRVADGGDTVVIGLGKERIVLKAVTGERGTYRSGVGKDEMHSQFAAYRGGSGRLDSVILKSQMGQGTTIIRFRPKADNQKND